MNHRLFLFILSIIFFLVNLQTLTLKTYTTASFKAPDWRYLLNRTIECPNNGVFKYFVLRKASTSGYYYWEYQCYSSTSSSSDYGEPILKDIKYSNTFTHSISIYYPVHLVDLRGGTFCCAVDYGLNSFRFTTENRGFTIKSLYSCVGIKTSYLSKLDVQTSTYNGGYLTVNPLVNMIVGKTDRETNDVIGYPLRGFQFQYNSGTFSYKYSWGKLRNMKTVLDSYKNKAKQLRDSNNQVN